MTLLDKMSREHALDFREQCWGSISSNVGALLKHNRQPTYPNYKPFIPGETKIPLNIPTYGPEEVLEALDSLLSGWVTCGKKVERFEKLWREYLDVHQAIMVNSGSSANLLALAALRAMGKLQEGDEVITPAVTWATTVFPIAQVGAVPVLVDVDLDTYNISPEAVERAITSRTKAIMPVHLLGNPCEMGPLLQIASNHGLLVIEDACEAHGAEWRDYKVGSLSDVATFSFFFSHHISTIEGGMVVGALTELADICRSIRSHGWIRDMSTRERTTREYPNIDPRFLFLHAGYNFRPTEIQGAFGIHQLPRLEGFIQHRRENAAYWGRELAEFGAYIQLQEERAGTRHAWFAYPILVRHNAPFTRNDLQDFLEAKGVETRPIEAGNMAVQPAMKHINHRVVGSLTNAQYIHDHAFFFGNHAGIGLIEREAIVNYFYEFFKSFGG